MKNMIITPPEGYEVDKDNSTFENIVFKKKGPRNIRERIQTMEDVFELNGTSEEEFDKKWKGFDGHEKAHAKELLIVAAYNQGERPDWSENNGQKKYYPWLKNVDGEISFFGSDWYCGHSFVSARQLYLGSEAKENLYDAMDKFLDVYKESRFN